MVLFEPLLGALNSHYRIDVNLNSHHLMQNKTLRESLDSESNIKLRNKLIFLRNKRHLSQRELAKNLSVTQSYISKVELGQRRLDFFELFKYFQALDYAIQKFLIEFDSM